MKKVIVFLAMIMAMNVASELMADNAIIRHRLPIFKKDNRGMKVAPWVVYNPTTGNYETVYVVTDANGFLNVTVASGTINAIVADPLAVTGTFWQGTQPVSGTLSVTQGGTWIIDNATTTAYCYQNGVWDVAQSGTWNIEKATCVIEGIVSVENTNYVGRISSGTSGMITETDTYTIIIEDAVIGWSFKYKNSGDVGNYADIRLSHTGDSIPLAHNDTFDEPDIKIPQAITFTLTNLQTGSTTLFYIKTAQ